MIETSIVESLSRIVGEANLLSSPYDLDRYSADALTPFRAYRAGYAFERLADLVARPATVEEVSQIVTLAAREGIPLVPYGGGTGVMGGVLPVRGGIVVDLKRLNRILEISPRDMTATVEPGVVLQDLEDALSEQGLMPGHDPYSVPIATVAGTISTNGVGYRAGAYGPMGQQVVSLQVALPDGRILDTRPVPKYSSGPNLNHLFIGSEGVFGIITRATIRVFRLPEAQVFATVAFDSFDQGFDAAAELMALGLHPTLLDLTEEEAENEEGNEIKLFLLFEGYREGVAAQEQRAMQVCAQFGGRDIGPGPTLNYWEARHESGERYKLNALGRPREERWTRQWGRSFDYLHMALPTSQVLEYRRRCDRILSDRGVRVVEYAIWSRPELFSMMVVPEDPSREGSRENLAEAVEEVLTLAQDLGGVMEYCHGVGMKLNHLLEREQGVGHGVIGDLKRVLDPANIMNPGKLGL